MPCLKYIMQNANTPDYRLLRGKTIECISLIGLAVGRDKFMTDCQEVMQLLLKTQTEEADLEDDDPQVSYMISAWARMCKILGKDFTQYLPLVMPPLLKTAAMKPEVAIFDAEDNKTDMFEVLLPTFAKLLAPDRNWSDRQWGICVFDALIEFGGPPSIKYQEAFLPTIVNGIVDKSAEV